MLETIAINRIMKRVDTAMFNIVKPNGVYDGLFIPANSDEINLEQNSQMLVRNSSDLERNSGTKVVQNAENRPNMERNAGTKPFSLQDSHRNKILYNKYAAVLHKFCKSNFLTGCKVYGPMVKRGARTFTIPLAIKPNYFDVLLKTSSHEKIALFAGSENVIGKRDKSLIVFQFQLDECDYTSFYSSDVSGKQIGFSTIGSPVEYDLDKISMPQTVVYGGSGAGKTNMIKAILLCLIRTFTPEELKMIILDYDGVYGSLENSEYLACAITPPDDIYAIMNSVQFALDILAERRSEGVKKERPWLVIEADEIVHILSETTKENREWLHSALRKLVNGTKFKVVVIYGAHEANKSDVPGKNRIGVRIAGAVDTRQANDVTGIKNSGAQHLTGSGDMLLSMAGKLSRFQAVHIMDSDFDFLKRVDHVPEPKTIYYDNEKGEWNDSSLDAADESLRTGRPPNDVSYRSVAKYLIALNTGNSASSVAKDIGEGKRQKDAHNKIAKKIQGTVKEDGYMIIEVGNE